MGNYMKILVVTKTYKDFEFWCKKHGVNPRHTEPFRYYGGSDTIRGLELSSVIRDGNWYDREDIDEDIISSCLNRQYKCPHVYLDSDDCPDCCH